MHLSSCRRLPCIGKDSAFGCFFLFDLEIILSLEKVVEAN
jgi:hypothetical protein